MQEINENKNKLLFQIRITANDELAKQINNKNKFFINSKLCKIMKENNAELMCQYFAFENFVKECERNKETDNALYRWTLATIKDENKKKKYLNSFTIYVCGSQIYEKKVADKLESLIRNLNYKSIKYIFKHDTNPKNNPQPPKEFLSS